jgi:hypothetical protein
MTNLTSSLTVRLVDDVSKPARTVSQALKDAETNAKAVAKAMSGTGATDRLQRSLSGLKASAKDIEQVAGAWKDYSKSAGLAANSANWTKAQINEVKAWEKQTITSLRDVRREQKAFYQQQNAAVEKAKANQASHGVMSKHGAVGAALAAGAGYTSAHSIFEAIKSTYEAGAERQHVRQTARNAGIGPKELGRIERSAIAANAVAPGMSVSEIMELHKETRSAVTKPEEAFHIIGDLAKAGSVLKSLGVDTASLSQIVKGGESLGLMNDPKRFKEYLSGQVKSMQVMGKTITPEQIYEAAKYSKSSGALLSDRFINTTLPSLIQELHGSSAGEALSSLTKSFRGGLQHQHLPVQKLKELGLLADPSQIRYNKVGGIMGYAGKLKNDDILASDPKKWFQETFKPAAVASGAKSLADQVLLLSQVLPQRAANLGRLFIQQEEAFEQHAKNYDAAADLDKALDNLRRDPKFAVKAFTNAVDNLEAAVSGPAMPHIARGVSWLASEINELAASAAKHPRMATAGGAVAAGGAIGGAGWLTYKLATGFGLPAAAGQLTVAAKALDAAAARLGAAPGGLPAPVKAAPKSVALASGGATVGGAIVGAAGPAALGVVGGGVVAGTVYGVMKGLVAVGAVQPTELKGTRAWNSSHQREMDARAPVWSSKGQTIYPGVDVPQPTPRPKDLPAYVPLPPPRPKDLTPSVDTAQVESAKQKIDDTKTSLDGLNVTVTPNVNAAGLQTVLGLVNSINEGLGRMGSLIAKNEGAAPKMGSGLKASLGAGGRPASPTRRAALREHFGGPDPGEL